MIETVQRLLAPIRQRLSLIVSRMVVTALADGKHLQSLQLQGLNGETLDNVPNYQPFGFASKPKGQGEAVVLFPGGQREAGIVLAVVDTSQKVFNVAPGDAALYASDKTAVHCRSDGTMQIKADGILLTEKLSELCQSLSQAKTADGKTLDPGTIQALTKLQQAFTKFGGTP